MTGVELRGVSVSYGDHAAVADLSLTVEPGVVACLLGPSGCGKTTVLRAIAGFERVDAGEIRLGGDLVSSPAVHVPPERRGVGMVFQEHALFPHLTVDENVAFALRHATPDERAGRVDGLLRAIDLRAHRSKYPHELSGGQAQRVALARALAPRPRVLLLDEPFSSLDVDLRERLSIGVRELLRLERTTAILVTHDQREAFAMADRIAVMHEGRIAQWGTAYEIYHRPATPFVADFVGEGVFLPARAGAPGTIEIELGTLRARLPPPCGARCGRGEPDCTLSVLLRPDDVIHHEAAPLRAEVVAKAFRGAEFLYTLRLPSGARVLALVPSHHDHPVGTPIGIRLEVDHVVAFHRPAPPPGEPAGEPPSA